MSNKLSAVLILCMSTVGLSGCDLLRVTGPCYGVGCPAGAAGHSGQYKPGEAPKAQNAPAPANSTSEIRKRASANRVRIHNGAARRDASAGNGLHDGASHHRPNSRRTDGSAACEPPSEVLAAACHRRFFRALDPAPQFRREIRRRRLSRSRPPILVAGFVPRMMRLMRRNHFFRDLIRHVIVMRKFHRITSAPLRQRNQFIRVAQHF